MRNISVIYLSSLLGVPDDWDELEAWIKDWCTKHHASFYCRPGEDFFIHEAKELAVREGNPVVLVDSLS